MPTVSNKNLRIAEATVSEVFRKLDANRDGKVTRAEFQKVRDSFEARSPVGYLLESVFEQGSRRSAKSVALKTLDARLSSAVTRLDGADTNRSGTVSKAELAVHAQEFHLGSTGRVDDALFGFTRGFGKVLDKPDVIFDAIVSR
jgi:Ca2+-binding EF-hand superfamily protein